MSRLVEVFVEEAEKCTVRQSSTKYSRQKKQVRILSSAPMQKSVVSTSCWLFVLQWCHFGAHFALIASEIALEAVEASVKRCV